MRILNERELLSLQDTAKTAAKDAGKYIQSQFDKPHVTNQKVGGDSFASQVVTAVDLKAQAIILSYLNDSIQSHDFGLLTEESVDDHSRNNKEFFWCIDPLDGTLPFTERRTGYAVSIALISKAGDPIIGVIYIPDLAECYSAIKGNGVFLNEQLFARDIGMRSNKRVLQFYMDISFQSEPYFNLVKSKMRGLVDQNVVKDIHFHSNFGGVRNAIGVMSSDFGCYFKYPKDRKGCGSIWDYAATRLFFEELGLVVTNAFGKPLFLNNPSTTFMNNSGILYATDQTLASFIQDLKQQLNAN